MFLSYIFFLATVFWTRKMRTPVWKSSALAPMVAISAELRSAVGDGQPADTKRTKEVKKEAKERMENTAIFLDGKTIKVLDGTLRSRTVQSAP
jgi:hypothetical protein